MPKENELIQIKQILDSVENDLRQVKNILFSAEAEKKAKNLPENNDSKIIEGIFDGQKMISQEGKHYDIPANYASKSKLVSGDRLKLTIASDGSFIFKQIGPIKRRKITGTLVKIEDGKFCVVAGGNKYQVLPASITYFKASDGDKLTILVPEEEPSEWAAVENLLDS